ncbi:MAG: selenide, water dikinase SelD [candidate division KSB1 bacterium]|nr:selenide, water dikinase SelD [candidate division KSB1 bacterium]
MTIANMAKEQLPIYLDYNATTPIDPQVAQAMQPYINRHFGNPSSAHAFGVAAKKAVEHARTQVAAMLGCRLEEVVFTSGGTESNNMAIIGVAYAYRAKGNHIITSQIEHPAVLEVCRFLESQGWVVTYLPVDEYGLVDAATLEEAITPQTVLVSIMHANNEVGTIEPIAALAEVAHRHGVLVHTDCAQSAGKIPVKVDELGVDLLSIAGHKLYAPKGVGALYVRTGVNLAKVMHGAGQELNRRPGTENVIEIVGLGEACALVEENLPAYAEQMRATRDRLETGLKERLPDLRVHGHPEQRLPNTSSLGFPGLEAGTILAELTGVAASAGAACHSESVEISHVLRAMGVPSHYAVGTIRFSTGRHTTASEIDRAIEHIVSVVERLSARAPAAVTLSEGIRLTHFTHGLGCACKLRPQLLEQVLRSMPLPTDPNVLVGPETSDDAAVYKIDDRTAVVQTVDFFTPVVDDPYQFGAIAAANSLSDIYAMGGRPLFALNVVGFPSNRLPIEVLQEILRGATWVAEQASIAIIGGHTVDDTEPKFGLAVTGVIAPDAIITNRAAQPGDVLILTKPIGTGILSTALKQGLLSKDQEQMLFRTMVELNRAAAEAMRAVGVHACTDITGFGLLGHLLEMMNGSHTSAELHAAEVPILPGVVELGVAGVVPGGTKDNARFTAPQVRYAAHISEIQRLVLNDAQTSGGLLIAVPEARAERLLEQLKSRGVTSATTVGRVCHRDEKAVITVR